MPERLFELERQRALVVEEVHACLVIRSGGRGLVDVHGSGSKGDIAFRADP